MTNFKVKRWTVVNLIDCGQGTQQLSTIRFWQLKKLFKITNLLIFSKEYMFRTSTAIFGRFYNYRIILDKMLWI